MVVTPIKGPASLGAEQRRQAPGHARKVPDPGSWGGEVPIDQGVGSLSADDQVPHRGVVVTHDDGAEPVPRERRWSRKSEIPVRIMERDEGGGGIVECAQQPAGIDQGAVSPQRPVSPRHVNPARDIPEHLTSPFIDSQRLWSALEASGAKVCQQGVNCACVPAGGPTHRAADLTDLAEVAPGKPALLGSDWSLDHADNAGTGGFDAATACLGQRPAPVTPALSGGVMRA